MSMRLIKTERVVFKLYSRMDALAMLAKMFDLTPDVLKVVVSDFAGMRGAPQVIDAEPVDAKSAADAYAEMLEE